MDRYSRTDVLRILRISSRQLAGWAKGGLIAPTEAYTFTDLLEISKLRELQEMRVRPGAIRESVAAMKQVSGMGKPLIEASPIPYGPRRVVFRHSGIAVDPVTGQFVLDFETVASAVHPARTSGKVAPIRPPERPEDLFARAIKLEESAETHSEAIQTYLKVVELDPCHASAYINLGTLYYNHHEYGKAEDAYRRAIASDHCYALAYFDLGNVLDETGRLSEAVEAYSKAISLAPDYADAHYNLALAYERMQMPRRALRHWKKYVQLDRIGPWSNHARMQIARILNGESLTVIWRRK